MLTNGELDEQCILNHNEVVIHYEASQDSRGPTERGPHASYLSERSVRSEVASRSEASCR